MQLLRFSVENSSNLTKNQKIIAMLFMFIAVFWKLFRPAGTNETTVASPGSFQTLTIFISFQEKKKF